MAGNTYKPTGSNLWGVSGTVPNVGATPPPPPRAQVKKPSTRKPTAKKPSSKKKSSSKKPKSALAKWLAGDTTYQQQVSDFNRTKTDYTANYNRQTGIINRDYAETQRALNRQGTQDRIDQQNDFAGRGILRSGVFAKSLADYNTEFNQRMKGLTTGRNDQLGDLSAQRATFLRQLEQEMNAAKQDAIRRRAAKLGI